MDQAIRIMQEINKEIRYIESIPDADTGNEGEMMCDSEGVLLSDKIKVLKQLITTIKGLRERGEI